MHLTAARFQVVEVQVFDRNCLAAVSLGQADNLMDRMADVSIPS
jgi:hypothetical protein